MMERTVGIETSEGLCRSTAARGERPAVERTWEPPATGEVGQQRPPRNPALIWKLLVLCGVGISCSGLVLGQERSRAENSPTAKSQAADEDSPTTTKPRGRLPNYWGKLGISREQRDDIYAVQARYRVQLESIQKQLAKLQAEQEQAMHDVLTADQQQRLKELLAEAERRRDRRRTATDADDEN